MEVLTSMTSTLTSTLTSTSTTTTTTTTDQACASEPATDDQAYASEPTTNTTTTMVLPVCPPANSALALALVLEGLGPAVAAAVADIGPAVASPVASGLATLTPAVEALATPASVAWARVLVPIGINVLGAALFGLLEWAARLIRERLEEEKEKTTTERQEEGAGGGMPLAEVGEHPAWDTYGRARKYALRLLNWIFFPYFQTISIFSLQANEA